MRNGVFYEPEMNNLDNQLYSILTRTDESETVGILTTSDRRKWFNCRSSIEKGIAYIVWFLYLFFVL